MIVFSVVALFLIFATVAFGAEWFVEGKPLGGVEIANTAKGGHAFKIIKNNGKIEIECKQLLFGDKSALTPPNRITAPSMALTSCTVIKPAGTPCEVESLPNKIKGQIETVPAEAVVEVGGVKITPQAGKTLATFNLVGAGCGGQAGKWTIKGSIESTVTKLAEETIEKPFSFTSTSGSELEIEGESEASEKAEFTGEDEIKLAAGQDWSYR
jgi:hypothetical protein